MSDHIDQNMAAWAAVFPDLDFSSWAITLRIGRIASFIQYQEWMYEPFGLTRGTAETILALRRSPKMKLSPSKLCETMLSSSATITARLDKLQQEGLITRRHDTKDRRGIVVQLTPRGCDLADRVLESVLQRRSRNVNVLSDQERATLSALLRKLLEHYENSDSDRPIERSTPSSRRIPGETSGLADA